MGLTETFKQDTTLSLEVTTEPGGDKKTNLDLFLYVFNVLQWPVMRLTEMP